jgi:hypothetical protein
VSATNGQQTPAGWYPDPAGTGSLRWWDGLAWTAHLQPGTPDRYAYPAQAAPIPPVAPGTPAYGPVIWVLTLLPLLSLLLLPLSLADFEQQLRYPFDESPYDPMAGLSPTGLLLQALGSFLGLVLYAAGVVLAVLDRRWLLARGYVRPFPWAFAFLNPVYPIGRSIVVRRRSGRGIAPMWVSFGIIALSLVVSVLLVVYVVNITVQSLSTMPGLPA